MRDKQAGLMQIGEISNQTGITIDAIRFYERNGLLAEPSRSQGGFRLYSAHEVATLNFIRTLQGLGFSLNEIRDFLSLRTNDLRACSEVRRRLDGKLRDIHAKRVALGTLERELKSVLKKCNSQLKHSRDRKRARCPMLMIAKVTHEN
jgi:DNA-binding transcriptional MerR regulator